MKNLYVLIILLSAFSGHDVFAQKEKIDSLKKILPSLKDSARIDCLNELSGSYVELAGDTATYYAVSASIEAAKINYVHGMAESLSYKGEIELPNSFAEAENLSRKAINLYRKTSNKKRLAATYLNLGFALYAQSFFTEAVKNLDTAYELYKKNGNASEMSHALSISGAAYEESGNYEKAFELHKKSLDIAIQNNNDWIRRFQLRKLGQLFGDIEDYKTALTYYRQAFVNLKPKAITDSFGVVALLTVAELFTFQHQYDSATHYYYFVDTSDKRSLRLYLTSIGEFYFTQKKYYKALPNFLRAQNYHKQSNDRNPLMRTLLDIAKTYLAVGNNDSALKYGNESLSMAKQTGAKQVIRDASEILSSVFDNWRKPDSAYFYYREFATMKDSVLNNIVKGRLAAYSFEQRIELLNKEKQIQQVQLQEQSLLRNILIASIIILLLLAAVIIRNIVLKRKSEKQSLEHKLQLQKLESKIESQQALLNERLRISRELHDDIGSTLGSISIYSEVAKKRTEKNENTNEVLFKIGLASRELIDKMSDIVWSLTLNNKNFEQLQNRMLAFAAMILAPQNVGYDFKTNNELKKIYFTGEQLKNVFLIFKEALHNIVKYADCKTVHVTLSLENDNLLMTVKDDGKGFDTSQLGADKVSKENKYLGGNGIKNMHARADDLKASLCIHSTVNEGTTVQLTLPLAIAT